MRGETLLERRFRVLGERSPLFYDEPLHLVRGEGVWVFDAAGRRYLDAYNNVPHVGHCHPRVTEALCRQARTLNTHTRYLDETVVSYAERLLATFDTTLSNVFFCCSGTEANELALRIARECTGGQGIIVTACAYHGNSAAVAQVSPLFTPLQKRGPFVRTVPVPDPYRERDSQGDDALVSRYLAHLETAIEGFERAGVKLAGVLFCMAFASEGLPSLPTGYLAQAIALVHEAGGLFIADEVQSGFGRFGSHLWGHQRLGAVPDIVTLGKPMGNGHPIAAVVTRPDLMKQFTRANMYFNTFGGNAVSCAAGMAVLDVLRDEHLLVNARTTGEYVLTGLRKLQARHSLIGDVRGAGQFIAVEIVTDPVTKQPAPGQTNSIVNAMRERGVLISRSGPRENVLKIRPPMPFSSANADQMIEALDDVLRHLNP